ncbi:T9SS type A sorting domain-containing protein [Fluviicola sp.]|uniref:T9SS type A sorting domain-containing protein n=1 Tax=Fluviicola sp. TaxID=1917219 RepID=UPI002827E57D|nr:tail fiber domain-containing protein [Fluviicola sp.]MDR0803083.1 tail fiber domain-containing protein [Fluviicola sp.]
MKTKSFILTSFFAVFALASFAQLKVDQYGRIGMGTNYPNPSYKCHVSGNLLCTSYPANPYYELRLKVGNGYPGCEIGASSDILAFWTSEASYNSLRASDFTQMSDSTLKRDIVPINQPLDRLMKIRPVFYAIENNKIDGTTGKKILQDKHNFGFLSQQIRDLFPEADITVTDHEGYVLMEYNQIIPITVASIQAQQKIIDSLKSEIASLKSQINSINSLGLGNDNSVSTGNVLNQNSPNPFNEKTEIKFSIDERNFKSASIVVFDMNGLLLKKYEIQNSGNGSITINGNDLKAGMYIYTLIVNQREIDSKRMILLN